MKLQNLLIFFVLASVTKTELMRKWQNPSSNDVRIIPSNPCAKYFWNRVYYKLCLKKLFEKIKKRPNWILKKNIANKPKFLNHRFHFARLIFQVLKIINQFIFLRFLIHDLRPSTASSANISERTHRPWVSCFSRWRRTFCLILNKWTSKFFEQSKGPHYTKFILFI